jgi:hypothetical protein
LIASIPCSRELRHRRPRLLRGDVRNELAQPVDERVPERGRRRRRVVEDVQLAVRHELAQPRLGFVARAAGREAEVELGRGEGGTTFCAIPPSTPTTLSTSR